MSARVIASLIALAVACDGGGDTLPEPMPGELLVDCTDTVEAVYETPPDLPAWTRDQRGAIVRCALDRSFTADELHAVVGAAGYAGPPLDSGATLYRIAYRTERAKRDDGTNDDGLTAALMVVPHTARAYPMPLVVAAHGSVGLAARCAPSLTDLDTGTLGSSQLMSLTPAGRGYLVIAPDYAGYGFDSIHAWQSSQDEAFSVLDATRAAARAFGAGTLSDDVFLMGHSQGGHAVLSANALADEYGMVGTIAGTYAFAPSWFAHRTFGAALSSWSGYNTRDNSGDLVYSLTYFFGHGELLDGPGGGSAIFAESKRELAAQVFADNCTGGAERGMRDLGHEPAEFLDPVFAEEVASDCSLFAICNTPLAKSWRTRFQADRPTIDTRGGPIAIWQGRRDATIPVDRAACGFERIRRDLEADPSATTAFTVCGDADASHAAIVPLGIDWVIDSISAEAGYGDPPAACPAEALLDPTDDTLRCNALPPNID